MSTVVPIDNTAYKERKKSLDRIEMEKSISPISVKFRPDIFPLEDRKVAREAYANFLKNNNIFHNVSSSVPTAFLEEDGNSVIGVKILDPRFRVTIVDDILYLTVSISSCVPRNYKVADLDSFFHSAEFTIHSDVGRLSTTMVVDFGYILISMVKRLVPEMSSYDNAPESYKSSYFSKKQKNKKVGFEYAYTPAIANTNTDAYKISPEQLVSWDFSYVPTFTSDSGDTFPSGAMAKLMDVSSGVLSRDIKGNVKSVPFRDIYS